MQVDRVDRVGLGGKLANHVLPTQLCVMPNLRVVAGPWAGVDGGDVSLPWYVVHHHVQRRGHSKTYSARRNHTFILILIPLPLATASPTDTAMDPSVPLVVDNGTGVR
jgi:hypothetical protein